MPLVGGPTRHLRSTGPNGFNGGFMLTRSDSDDTAI